MSWRGALPIIVALSGVADGAPPDREAVAVEHLNRGHQRYTSGDYAGALVEFTRARDLVPAKATPYRWLGMTYAALGRCADTIASLDSFIQRVAPNDPRLVEVNGLRGRCQEELAPRVGVLVVESRPDGAEVRLDDENAPPIGATPCRRDDVPVGVHVVLLRREGHEAVRREVIVGRHDTVRLDVELRALAPPPVVPAPIAAAPVRSSLATPPPPRPSRRRWPIWLGLAAGALTVAASALAIGLALTQGEPVFNRVVASEPVR